MSDIKQPQVSMATEAPTTPSVDVVFDQIRIKLGQVADLLINYIFDFAKVENEAVDHCLKLLVAFNNIQYHDEKTSMLVISTTKNIIHYFKQNAVKAKAAAKNGDFVVLTALVA